MKGQLIAFADKRRAFKEWLYGSYPGSVMAGF